MEEELLLYLFTSVDECDKLVGKKSSTFQRGKDYSEEICRLATGEKEHEHMTGHSSGN